jgi:polysaccharide pyruvyl transferase CsaB
MNRDERRPRIVLLAYAGSPNLGDRCIIEAELAALRSHWNQSHVSALVVDSQELSGLVERSFSRSQLLKFVQEIRRANVLILGGGGIIQDDSSFLNLLYFLWPTWLANLCSVPVVSYGLGVGPLHRSVSRRLVRTCLKRAQALCVRDEESARLLVSCGIPERIVHVTADPVVNYPFDPFNSPKSANPRCTIVVALRAYKPGGVGLLPVAVYQKALAESKSRVAVIAQALGPSLQWLKHVANPRFVFVSFHADRDETFNRNVASAAGLDGTEVDFLSNLSARQGFECVANATFVFGMRLHACILAARCGVPFVALSYAPKVRSFAEAIDLGPVALDFPDCGAASLLSVVQLVWHDSQRIVSHLVDELPKLQQRERQNIEAVSAALDKSG